MCLICVDIALEKAKPKDIMKFMVELTELEDQKHVEELTKAVSSTSIPYQMEVVKEAMKDCGLDYGEEE